MGFQIPHQVGLFVRLFPLPEDYAASGKSLEELYPAYRKWELFALAFIFVLTPPFSFALWWILEQLSIGVASLFPDAVFQVRPSGIAWWIPAILLGLLTTALPMDTFFRWRLKGRYGEYLRYSNLRHNYDGVRALKWLFIVVPVGIFLFLVAMLHWRAVFTIA